MTRMICSRATPCLAVSTTITSVVFGAGGLEGGWGEADRDCPANAVGSRDIRRGKSILMKGPRFGLILAGWYHLVPSSFLTVLCGTMIVKSDVEEIRDSAERRQRKRRPRTNPGSGFHRFYEEWLRDDQ